MSVFDCLASAGSLMRCGGVSSVPENGNPRSCKCGYWWKFEDCPLRWVRHVLHERVYILTHMAHVPLHIFFLCWPDPRIAVPRLARLVKTDVNLLGTHDGVGYSVGPLSHIHR